MNDNRLFNPNRQDTEVLFMRTYRDMLKFSDGSRQDLEVRYHIRKHLNFMFTSKQYERYCILKAIRYNQSVGR